MQILLCDDEQRYIDEIKVYIERFLNERSINFVIDSTNNPQEIIDNDTVYQLAFLDIQMDNIDGISLAKILKERNDKIVIFFVTNYNDYQDDAMDLRAFRFFEKPIKPDRLESSLQRAMEYIDESYVDFFVSANNEQIKVLVNDVIYVERANRQVTLVTTNGVYKTKETFDEWCNILQNLFFYQVHKSFIVNIHYVTKYRYDEIILNNTIVVPIASRKQAEFRKFWFTYLRRR